MNLTESVKQQAGQAWGTVQQGLGQGHVKFEELRANRQAQSLLRNLGAAYYAQQREGGSADAVTAALAAMDKHVEAHRPDPNGTDPNGTEGAASATDTDTTELQGGTAAPAES
jgi:hypothetical protein